MVLPGWDALGRAGQGMTTQTKLSPKAPQRLAAAGSCCWKGLSKFLASLSVNSGAGGAMRAGLKGGWAVTCSCPQLPVLSCYGTFWRVASSSRFRDVSATDPPSPCACTRGVSSAKAALV